MLCGALAHVPDHYPETRASLVERGVPDPDADHRLRPLCTTCHDTYGMSYKPWSKRTNTNVTLVAGPPCSGKNTYVEQHRLPHEVVVDYDEIMAEVSGQPLHHHDEAAIAQVLALRDTAIARLLSSGQRGWIIATAPTARERHMHKTNVVLLMPTQATVTARADEHRPPEWRQYIRAWYQRYEPDDRDHVVM